MKITITFETTIEEDGYESITAYTRKGVETLDDLSWYYSEASRIGGWTYTEAVSIHTDEGKTFRSPF